MTRSLSILIFLALSATAFAWPPPSPTASASPSPTPSPSPSPTATPRPTWVPASDPTPPPTPWVYLYFADVILIDANHGERVSPDLTFTSSPQYIDFYIHSNYSSYSTVNWWKSNDDASHLFYNSARSEYMGRYAYAQIVWEGPTATPSPSPNYTPSPTPSMTPTPSPSPTPSPTPTPNPVKKQGVLGLGGFGEVKQKVEKNYVILKSQYFRKEQDDV